ncbi:MAG TPA: histidine phosphatase family protein [Acidimicrobiales bacterium]|nr:histidine phosphatase family protein [Acidimicrobiales bacterium]
MSSQFVPEPGMIVLVRHGQTEWSRNGRHTGRTDLPLDDGGREAAAVVGDRLRGDAGFSSGGFASVLVSPLRRAADTCTIAGFGAEARTEASLAEWDYGDYEGLTTPEIRERNPGWDLWSDGCPGGESPEEVGARADSALGVIRSAAGEGAALVFSHGHFLRVLTARWLGLDASEGRLWALDPATIGKLGWERDVAVIRVWNA